MGMLLLGIAIGFAINEFSHWASYVVDVELTVKEPRDGKH